LRLVIDRFDFPAGRRLAAKYCVDAYLGSGWEGEVYRVTEVRTGIPRAAKIFYPQRNVRDRAVRVYARKLERLRDCPLVVQYHHTESLRHKSEQVTCLISEFVDGELLEDFVRRQPGKRLQSFEALCLMHALASGIEQIHALKEYHGDIHDHNVLVQRRGIGFDVKLLDLYHWGASDRNKTREDVIQLVRLLYDAVGGKARYAKQPPEIKAVCCGLRRGLIIERFPTVSRLRRHLESFSWPS
jgi:tRNA A-37 threonylcarbamoyl transferase component Bud32